MMLAHAREVRGAADIWQGLSSRCEWYKPLRLQCRKVSSRIATKP
jgi:hypothetical protein